MTRIYFIETCDSRAIKVGISSNPARRLAHLQIACPDRLAIITTVPGAQADESRLHRIFHREHINGEWFRGDGDLREFVISLAGLTDEAAVARMRALAEPGAIAEEVDTYHAEVLTEACFAEIREKGVAYWSAELTKVWGPKGRPVSTKLLLQILDGKFNFRAEWVDWFLYRSERVREAMRDLLANARRQRMTRAEREAEDQAAVVVANLEAELRETYPKHAEQVMRRARAR